MAAIVIMIATAGSSGAQEIFLGSPGAHARRMQNPLYADYHHRLRGRRTEALYTRRAMNMSKPPARGWTAISVPYNPLFGAQGRSFIEMGWVRQPPIPSTFRRRAVRVVPVYDYERSYGYDH